MVSHKKWLCCVVCVCVVVCGCVVGERETSVSWLLVLNCIKGGLIDLLAHLVHCQHCQQLCQVALNHMCTITASRLFVCF